MILGNNINEDFKISGQAMFRGTLNANVYESLSDTLMIRLIHIIEKPLEDSFRSHLFWTLREELRK